MKEVYIKIEINNNNKRIEKKETFGIAIRFFKSLKIDKVRLKKKTKKITQFYLPKRR